MRGGALVLAAVLAAGCSAHTQVRVGNVASLGGPPPAGTSVSGTALGIDLRGHSLGDAIVATVLFSALLSLGRTEAPREVQVFGPTPPRGEMLEARRIHEQDCTRPISDHTANLRCR
jgi:hypothetical protein